MLANLKKHGAVLVGKMRDFLVNYFSFVKWIRWSLMIFATKQGEETEFLPAALEIVEKPPLPASRAITLIICLFFSAALFWACAGSIDIVATAPGKIVPTGRTKIIQPLESGVVSAIHVYDGQSVKAGDVLVEINSTINASERDRLKGDYMQAMLDTARLKAALDLKNDPLANFTPPDDATPDQIALQKNFLLNQVNEIHAKLGGFDHQIAQHEGDKAAIQATVTKLKDSIPYLQKRADTRSYLADKGYGSKLDYLTVQQDLVEHQQDLNIQKGRVAEAEGAIAALKDQRQQAENEYRRDVLKQLSEAEDKAHGYHEQVLQAAQKYSFQTLTAPVDGTVQQLAVHTEGGVVTPAQALMSIVPSDSGLEIEAMVSNRDIGFVHAGQEVQIKVDTFNFTKYGLLHGVVENVSQDAIQRNKPTDEESAKHHTGDESDNSEPAGQELVYSARVSMNQTQMQIDDTKVNLTPGMAVTVEIKTGSRRIIEYLLSPLIRHKQQAMRER